MKGNKHMKIITKFVYPALALFAAASTVLPRIQAADEPAAACAQCRSNGNTSEGKQALGSLTTGINDTAMGFQALKSLTTGNYNTAMGWKALSTSNGDDNVAVGALALSNNTSSQNVAVGTAALGSNTTGGGNTAVGENALTSNTSGSNNVAVGGGALFFGSGTQNVALGFLAGSNTGNGGGNIYIGAQMLGNAGDTNQTYIGNIGNTNVSGSGTDTVTVNLTTGLIGHLTSSRRYKEEIKPMENASETLYRLNPVTYRYKKAIDPTRSPAFGLIAEEVAEVNPNLVARDAKGQPESVHYEMINTMLLNEFLKEHRTVRDQQKELNALKTELRKQAVLIQKVSDKVELNKPVPQMVADGR
jgi:Chaperone of endosialidase